MDAESREAEMLYQRPGLTVFLGKRSRRGSTDVMAGRPPMVPWFRAVHCVGDDHETRAQAVVDAYKQRAKEPVI